MADLIGTVLFPTEGARLLLGQLYRFAPDDVKEALSQPSVFYESLVDDEAQLLTVGELVPTIKDPTSKLHKYHGEMVSIQGIALGGMVRTEDVPQLQNVPIHFTVKAIGVVDLTGAMPIFGISSEDVSGEVFGFFRFALSVYNFTDDKAFAFLINKEAVPLDPIVEVTRANFGDRVQTGLTEYLVTRSETLQLAEDLVLEQVDLLVPTNTADPIIMTRRPDLAVGDYLKSVSFDGFVIDGRLLGVAEELISKHGPKIIVVTTDNLAFERGVLPTPIPVPTAIPRPTPVAFPTPGPTPTPALQATSTPAPTATPAPTPIPTYVLTVSVEPSEAGTVTLIPAGGTYPSGTTVTFTALAAPGFSFDRWGGDASGTGATTLVLMDRNSTIVAHFRRSLP